MKLYEANVYDIKTKETEHLGWFKSLEKANDIAYNYVINSNNLNLYPMVNINFTSQVITYFAKNCDFFNMIKEYMISKINKDNSVSINVKRINGQLILTIIKEVED